MTTPQQKMLEWCKLRTRSYTGVKVVDFSGSWRDGLAFCALIDSIKPGLLDFSSLSPTNELANHTLAFKVAQEHLGIPELLEPEDMLVGSKPEQRSVMTYLGQFYQKYSGGTQRSARRSTSSPLLLNANQKEQLMTRVNPKPAAHPTHTTPAPSTAAAPTAARVPIAGRSVTQQAPPQFAQATPTREPASAAMRRNVTATPPPLSSSAQNPSSKPTPATANTSSGPAPSGANPSNLPPLSNSLPPSALNNSAQTSTPPASRPVCAGSGIELKPGDKTLEWQGKYFLLEYFQCTTCKKNLVGLKSVMNVAGNPYCDPCGRKAFVTHNLAKKTPQLEDDTITEEETLTLPIPASMATRANPRQSRHSRRVNRGSKNLQALIVDDPINPMPGPVQRANTNPVPQNQTQQPQQQQQPQQHAGIGMNRSMNGTPNRNFRIEQKPASASPTNRNTPVVTQPAIPAWKAKLLEKKRSDTTPAIAEVDKKEAEKKEMERKEAERKEAERKEVERKENERKEMERKENERKELERKENERKDQERKENERRDLERKENERKELERKEQDRKDNERKDWERRELERKENERKENERRENERKENERKENERRDNERKENERREFERKENERRDNERKENERREFERKENERRDNERKENERKELERRETERKENERREFERKENERREFERKENERKEKDRKDLERKENERRELERKENERKDNQRKESERREIERIESERKEAERVARDKKQELEELNRKKALESAKIQQEKLKLISEKQALSSEQLEIEAEMSVLQEEWNKLKQEKSLLDTGRRDLEDLKRKKDEERLKLDLLRSQVQEQRKKNEQEKQALLILQKELEDQSTSQKNETILLQTEERNLSAEKLRFEQEKKKFLERKLKKESASTPQPQQPQSQSQPPVDQPMGIQQINQLKSEEEKDVQTDERPNWKYKLSQIQSTHGETLLPSLSFTITDEVLSQSLTISDYMESTNLPNSKIPELRRKFQAKGNIIKSYYNDKT
eukprot:TRINITY_DN1259_c0_g1_i4.p1 TRINITY_DN1259_c0_g1~~TRINITY_DN1259_c0_g1_i4.p1  ORF type:complete len:1009 (-),score=372.24 TRINITY_DN1259_c0_g1_i4:79-3105(-)